jgi:capsular polysaccharide biosynthesis protein
MRRKGTATAAVKRPFLTSIGPTGYRLDDSAVLVKGNNADLLGAARSRLLSTGKTAELWIYFDRVASGTAFSIRRLGVRMNAIFRHPLRRDKRREYRRCHVPFEKTYPIGPIRSAAEMPGNAILSSERGEWVGHGEANFLNEKSETYPIGPIRSAAEVPGNAILSSERGEWVGHGKSKFLNENLEPAQAPVKGLDRYVASLKNVTLIGGTRYLITEDGQLLHDEEAAHSSSDVSIKYARASRAPGGMIHLSVKQKPHASIPAGVHLMAEGDVNYFHFIVEILPRLKCIGAIDGSKSYPLLITRGLHENLLTALAIVNEGGREIIELEPDVLYHVDHLIYPSDTASILNIYVRPATKEEVTLSIACLRSVRDQVLTKVRNPSSMRQNRRLYVRRGKKMRALANEAEIEEMLIDQGFETVAIEDLSFRVQAKLFAEADIVVMPTGAAVTNVMWCRPEARILILTSDHPAIQHNIWQLLSEVSGSELAFLRGPRANKVVGLYGVHDDFEIDVNALRSAVESPKATSAATEFRVA